ncbi:MAG: hypothetical protein WBD20_28230 [Pirellulaceae bacterium]
MRFVLAANGSTYQNHQMEQGEKGLLIDSAEAATASIRWGNVRL